MIAYMRCIFLMLLAFFLLSCAHHSVLRKIDNSCQLHCEGRAQACFKICNNSCTKCIAKERMRTEEAYVFYKNEQYVKGALIARDLQSYQDPLQCRKTTCSCSSDYNICVQSCGGVIYKRLQVAPICQ